jgi:hypothetical protein
MLAETTECRTVTVAGASGLRSTPPSLNRLTHTCTSEGTIDANGRSPNVG